MVPHMIAFIVIGSLVLTSLLSPAQANDCAEKACITVYSQNDQIIIEAKKGKTTVKKSIAQAPRKPPVKPIPQPTVRPLFFPPAPIKVVVPEMYFWCDLPTIFQSRVDIIGEVVDVTLRPSFTWSFGDGTVVSTMQNGAPYPNGTIRHSYSRPGTYVITLLTTWNGSYTHNAQVRAVTGTVKKISIAAITVVQGPTHFITNKG